MNSQTLNPQVYLDAMDYLSPDPYKCTNFSTWFACHAIRSAEQPILDYSGLHELAFIKMFDIAAGGPGNTFAGKYPLYQTPNAKTQYEVKLLALAFAASILEIDGELPK